MAGAADSSRLLPWRAGLGHAQRDRTGEALGVTPLLGQVPQREVDAFDLTEPALGLGPGPTLEQAAQTPDDNPPADTGHNAAADRRPATDT